MTSAGRPDAWLGGKLKLHQPERGAHRAGTDAVLLAGSFEILPGTTVFDLGAGTGAVGLGCAVLWPGGRVVLVERDPGLAAMARTNVDENGLGERVRVIETDVLASAAGRRRAGLAAGCADIVLTNPPYLDPKRHRPSPVSGKAAAHMLDEDGLDRWIRTCADLLRPGGRLGMIHRADYLPACLDALRRRFGGIAIRPVHAEADAPATRILVAGTKGSRSPLSLAPPLVLHRGGAFTAEAEALHRGEPRRL